MRFFRVGTYEWDHARLGSDSSRSSQEGEEGHEELEDRKTCEIGFFEEVDDYKWERGGKPVYSAIKRIENAEGP